MSSRYIIIFILILSRVTLSQWFPQASGTNYALKSVSFTDPNTGYICGYNLVLKTTNGGLNWNSSFLQGNHNSIIFSNSSTGYISSDSGKIFKTTNAGLNWNTQASNTIKNLTSINFLNSETGIVTGMGKTLLKTTNGGNDWFSISNIIWEVDFLSSKILSADIYFVTGTETFIIRTTNGGANWIPYTHGEVNPLFTIDFINDNTGYASGCCGMFMSTTNAGINWTFNYYLSLGFTFYSLKFINPLTGYICGSNGMIYRTTNSGLWWDSTVTTTDEILYSINMVNSSTGWAVGNFGNILKTTNGGGTGYPIGISQISNEIPNNYKLEQNYPNPFNPETKIRFETPLNPPEGGKLVKLFIYDVSGKLVKVLLEGYLDAGVYEVEFDGSGFASGIYYYILQSGSYRESMKMVLIK